MEQPHLQCHSIIPVIIRAHATENTHRATTDVCLISTPMFVLRWFASQSAPRYGAVPSLEPANSLFPLLARTTDRALTSLLPSFARLPCTVTMSSIFIESRDQPKRIKLF